MLSKKLQFSFIFYIEPVYHHLSFISLQEMALLFWNLGRVCPHKN